MAQGCARACSLPWWDCIAGAVAFDGVSAWLLSAWSLTPPSLLSLSSSHVLLASRYLLPDDFFLGPRMASTEDLTFEEKVELNRAVMHELTKSLNGPAGLSKFDIRHLLENAEYCTDAEKEMNTFADDDWRDIMLRRDDQSFPPNTFVQLYDDEREMMYHIEVGSSNQSYSEEGDKGVIVTASTDPLPGDDGILQARVDKVLDRLILENGRLGPRGYQEWMARKSKRRFVAETTIPGYATLCVRCDQVVANSLALYQHFLFQVTGTDTETKSPRNCSNDVFDHHGTITALLISASAGCHLCSLFSAPIKANLELCNEGCSQSYFLQISNCDRFVLIFVHSIGHPTQQVEIWDASLPTSGLSTLRHTNTSAPEIITLAQTWLTRCLEQDGENCMMPTKFLPSRLVRVVAKDGSLDSAYLVLREDLSTEVPYLTLSHCWGKLKMTSLNNSTFEEYRSRIPLSHLSKTFRESLQVTIWLGYEYIWIDSLCIQQDSESDWENEAAMMGSIYRHSMCTLAATGAEDGDIGLFFERSALSFTHCPLFKLEDGERLVAERGQQWPAPLSERAWAVQERYLSPRIISFGSDKVSWSCRRTEAYEGPDAHRPDLPSSAFLSLLDQGSRGANFAWKALVEQYSGCKLSFWKDKWPAFQGLANEVSSAQDWKMVHGLREHLLDTTELLWYTSRPELGTLELGEPSWSWLNIKGQVVLEVSSDHADADIVLQDLAATTTTGETIKGSSNNVLQIKACLAELRSELPGKGLHFMDCTFTVRNALFCSNKSNRLLNGTWFPDTDPFNDNHLWALQIYWTYVSNNGTVDYHSDGLVIAAVEGRPGFWRRVGKYGIHVEHPLDAEQVCPWNREKETIYLI